MHLRPQTSIFVISLETATARRSKFAAAATTDFLWHFFDAHKALGDGLSYDAQQALMHGGRMLTPAELGCYSSHYTLWNNLLRDENADRYLIFEDDITIDWLFVKALLAMDEREIGCDFLRLYYMKTVPTRKIVGPFLNVFQIVELLSPGFGAQAYLIDKVAAARLVNALKNVIEPVDLAMESPWRHGVRNLSVFPFPVIHQMGESQIGTERRNAAPKPLWMKLVRGGLRVSNDLRRRWWHARSGRL